MRISRELLAAACVCLLMWLASSCPAEEQPAGKDSKPRMRSLELTYGASLKELPAGARVRVWIPVPQASPHQTIKNLSQDLPAPGRIGKDAKYGNKILYFETRAPNSGTLSFSTSYHVVRRELRGLAPQTKHERVSESQRQLFLKPNRKVPLQGKHLDLLKGLSFSSEAVSVARTLYDRVDEHVRYDKSQPGYGNGDVLWVCDSRFGNCTDFHSLFISLARARGIPARFEIGVPLPVKRGEGDIGGYHCWASFMDDQQRWLPVDISEADKHPELKQYYFGNLTENRVSFTIGRDIVLSPPQETAPLNYFVYPHVEVDGKLWKNIDLRFRFRDQ